MRRGKIQVLALGQPGCRPERRDLIAAIQLRAIETDEIAQVGNDVESRLTTRPQFIAQRLDLIVVGLHADHLPLHHFTYR